MIITGIRRIPCTRPPITQRIVNNPKEKRNEQLENDKEAIMIPSYSLIVDDLQFFPTHLVIVVYVIFSLSDSIGGQVSFRIVNLISFALCGKDFIRRQ
jgi:hypothetical protein